MSLFELKDVKTIPDSFHDYTAIRDSGVPLVIDNGSYKCRVGWASNEEPLLIFRNLIAKPRKDRVKKDGEIPVAPPIQIGNDIINIEAMRFQLKTQFDRNVVTHYHNQEQIFDYIFNHLSIDTEDGFNHPIILTEPLANPNYSRQLMSELLFECYNAAGVCYGIDSLFSFAHNQIGDNGLIISCGYHTTHIIPVLNGTVIANKARRINLGGFHMINYFHRLLQLKYPVHVNAITLSRIEWLLHNHCSIAEDYMSELKKWALLEFYEKHIKKIQLPYNTPASSVTLTAEQKIERKRELARRLADLNARKREDKLAEDEELLQKLIATQELYDNGDMNKFNYALIEIQIPNYEELEKLILNTMSRIDRTKQKMTTEASSLKPQSFPFEEKFQQIPQPPSDITLDEWIQQTKQKRAHIIDKRQIRRQRKQDLAKRRTAAAQERMRIISQLARKEKGTDDFGMRDEDWDVYKAISKETGDTDSEAENEKLLECEEILRHHDPAYEEPQFLQECVAESHQLHVGVEAIRAPELLFQPSMIGSSEAGLAETIDFVLKMFDENDQLILANSVFLTGGCSNFPGLENRLQRELLEMRPFQTPHKIFRSKKPNTDAWYGARNFAASSIVNNYIVTKSDYDENGGEYLREHSASNKYFATPDPIVIASEINE